MTNGDKSEEKQINKDPSIKQHFSKWRKEVFQGGTELQNSRSSIYVQFVSSELVFYALLHDKWISSQCGAKNMSLVMI